jgi:hypothetical protein
MTLLECDRCHRLLEKTINRIKPGDVCERFFRVTEYDGFTLMYSCIGHLKRTRRRG